MSIGISIGDLQATAASIPHQIPATPMHLYNGVTMHSYCASELAPILLANKYGDPSVSDDMVLQGGGSGIASVRLRNGLVSMLCNRGLNVEAGSGRYPMVKYGDFYFTLIIESSKPMFHPYIDNKLLLLRSGNSVLRKQVRSLLREAGRSGGKTRSDTMRLLASICRDGVLAPLEVQSLASPELWERANIRSGLTVDA